MNPTETVTPLPQPSSSSKRPKMMSVIVAIIVLIIVVGGVIFVVRRHSKTTSVVTSSSVRQATVNVNAIGFIPETIHVKVGTIIVWQNVDTSPHHVASDPYPADNGTPGLDSKTMLPNSSYSYSTVSAQTIHYHDDTAPTHNGTIVVEK